MIAAPDAATFATVCIVVVLSIISIICAVLSEQREREADISARRMRRELKRHPFGDLTDETTIRLVHGRREGDEP